MLRAGDVSRESAFLQVLISPRICSSDTLELPEHLSRHSAIRGIAAARLALSHLQLSRTYDSLTESDVVLRIKGARAARVSSLDLLQAVFRDFQGQSAPSVLLRPQGRSFIADDHAALITAECLLSRSSPS